MQKNFDLNIKKISDTRVSEKLYTAHILTWKTYTLLGTLLFTIFYWMIPAWLYQEIMPMQSGTIRPIAEVLFMRHIHWIQLTGIALGSICILFAIRNYLFTRSIKRSISINNESNIFRRLFTK